MGVTVVAHDDLLLLLANSQLVSGDWYEINDVVNLVDVNSTLHGATFVFQAILPSALIPQGLVRFGNDWWRSYYDGVANQVVEVHDHANNHIYGEHIAKFHWGDAGWVGNTWQGGTLALDGFVGTIAHTKWLEADINLSNASGSIQYDEVSGAKIDLSGASGFVLESNLWVANVNLVGRNSQNLKVARNTCKANANPAVNPTISAVNAVDCTIVDNQLAMNGKIWVDDAVNVRVSMFTITSSGTFRAKNALNCSFVGRFIDNNGLVNADGAKNTLFNTLVADTVAKIELMGVESAAGNPLSYMIALHHADIKLAGSQPLSIQYVMADGQAIIDGASANFTGELRQVVARRGGKVDVRDLGGTAKRIEVSDDHLLDVNQGLGYVAERLEYALAGVTVTDADSNLQDVQVP